MRGSMAFASALLGSSSKTRSRSRIASTNSVRPSWHLARRNKAFTLCRSSLSTLLQQVSAHVGCISCKKHAALFNSEVRLSSEAWILHSWENFSVSRSNSITFLYLSKANSKRLLLNSFAPQSFRAAAMSSLSSLDMLHKSMPFLKSTSSTVKTTFVASTLDKPICESMAFEATVVTSARSFLCIAAEAQSRASQTSPSPELKVRVFGPLNPGRGFVPSVAASTLSETLKPSRGLSCPSPSRIVFFLTVLSWRMETSLVS
mmetsp:Transcript_38322/g.105561  ORF Transcript_38322/g.105561 Transcript_38322/m.105561 type:complete len:260 (+) Transcript_38322:589-1368(+)